ncbi:hypothetical protein [Aeromonas caviae]|uniref:hypothetical protein n=1 Tax=Aeromonas caviae TaxID=648 RepID=UPI002E7B19BB|nr:hypothetical protein [Aeromonas caviae]MEE1913714.1 hypothetical protein [Aeromonas caviae]
MASLLARVRKMTSRLRPKAAEVRVASASRCPGKSHFERERRKAFADDLLQQPPIVSMQEAWFDESSLVSHRDNDSSRHSSSSSSSDYSSSDYSSSDYSSRHSSSSDYSSSSSSSSSSSDSGGSCSSD